MADGIVYLTNSKQNKNAAKRITLRAEPDLVTVVQVQCFTQLPSLHPLSSSHTLLPLAAVACVVAALRALLHAFMKSNQAGIRWKANYAGSEGA